MSNFAQTRPSHWNLLPQGRLLLRSRRYNRRRQWWTPTIKSSSSGSTASSQGVQYGYPDTSDHYRHCAADRRRRLVWPRTLVLVGNRWWRATRPTSQPTARRGAKWAGTSAVRISLFRRAKSVPCLRLDFIAIQGPRHSTGRSLQRRQRWSGEPHETNLETHLGFDGPNAAWNQIPSATIEEVC
jgi:hypothetical protein